MKISFFHSHKFRYDGKVYSSTGGLGIDYLSNKYMDEKDEISIYARIIPAVVDERLSPITDKRVHIKAYADVNLRDVITEADICIMRLPSPIGFKACMIAKKLGKPYLVEVVGCVKDAYWNYSLLGKVLAYPAYIIMKKCVKQAKYSAYVTQEFLQRRYPCDGKSIGVSDVEMPSIDEVVLQSRLNRINNNKEKIVLGTVGAIDVIYKGQESVIRALGLLKQQGLMNYEYRLIGAGSPERLKRIAKQCNVEDQVIFMGPKPHDEIFFLLDNLDVYIQPSYLEGLCRSLLEALSRGCPAIASDVGGNSELVDNSMLYKTGKEDAQSIMNMLRNLTKDSLVEKACRNFEHAKNYDPILLKQKWELFYEDFLEDSFTNN